MRFPPVLTAVCVALVYGVVDVVSSSSSRNARSTIRRKTGWILPTSSLSRSCQRLTSSTRIGSRAIASSTTVSSGTTSAYRFQRQQQQNRLVVSVSLLQRRKQEQQQHHRGGSTTTTCLMGWFENWFDAAAQKSSSPFLQDRSNDFIPLDSTEVSYGPGPLLVAYNVPITIDTSELYDMMEDAITTTTTTFSNCTIYRIYETAGSYDDNETTNDDSASTSSTTTLLLDMPLSEALDTMMQSVSTLHDVGPPSLRSMKMIPVLLFSGFTNTDMMSIYNIMAPEIWNEMMTTSAPPSVSESGTATTVTTTIPPPACAKVVPRAMSKPLRQVLEEIAGDHQDATTATPTTSTNTPS